jgi:hypothetical protein
VWEWLERKETELDLLRYSTDKSYDGWMYLFLFFGGTTEPFHQPTVMLNHIEMGTWRRTGFAKELFENCFNVSYHDFLLVLGN